MSDLLAVDPGINSPGVALFRDGLLIAAAHLSIPASVSMTHGQRALAAASIIVTWVTKYSAKVSTVAYEWPQVYPRSRVDPNDLIAMAAVDGAVSCALAVFAESRGERIEIRTYLPSEWTGQLSKDTRKGKYWASPRGVRIWSRLNDAERMIAQSLNHDAADAVGIGLHALARLGIRRALTTGRPSSAS
jgi:hypothetical protein